MHTVLPMMQRCVVTSSQMYLKVYGPIEKKITQETAHSYLYQCVRNKCIDYVRRQQLNRQYESFIKGTADTDTDMEPDATEERMQTVQECIDLLPPKTKLVLEECYFHNKKYKEVATALDISTNAIKKHIVKALSVLRERCRGTTDEENS